ncbi:WAP four-disulfide core domain protein 18-like [Myotis myotis]|uniref:WAP four-disulfide core domain protein 18-like n=1 Tax=Myotis myotis TaxID=51298 RepID=UPI00174A8449|nr:WAP four-disulfide core domain protein 18-like [Myotis myotis]
MKTGTVFVLVAFVILGMEMAFAQRHSHGGGNRPGVCPKVPKGTVGVCVISCRGDDSCPRGMKCCSTGCGRQCKPAIHVGGVDDHVDDHVEEEWGV